MDYNSYDSYELYGLYEIYDSYMNRVIHENPMIHINHTITLSHMNHMNHIPTSGFYLPPCPAVPARPSLARATANTYQPQSGHL